MAEAAAGAAEEAKRQKTEEGYVPRPPGVPPAPGQEAEVKQEEPPSEKETDSKPLSAKPLKENMTFETADCTLNMIPSLGGKVLMPLSEGGLQYLMAGARANAGMKSGRYVYEVKVIETLNPSEGPQRSNRTPVPRQLLRLGFSTLDSPLLMGVTDADDSVSFDSEGFYYCGKQRHAVSQRLSKDQVIAVLLNLDPSSPNKNTISLFREGVRIAQPQALPESLIGKPLFPHLCFKNITVQVNFGPPMAALPFKCHGLGQAPAVDAVQGAGVPSDGKFEILVPIAVPDEGTFDWLDDFLSKNPRFTELSDRAIGDWAEQSGVFRNKTYSWKHCNDKPDLQTGLPLLDDWSARKILSTVAPTQPRNYVVMEVKSNLMKEERQMLLRRFKRPGFKVVAQVVMGQPPAEFTDLVHKALLEEKQAKLDEEWQKRKAEKERERQERARLLQLEEARRKAEADALARAQAEAMAQAEAVKAQLMAQQVAEASVIEIGPDGNPVTMDPVAAAVAGIPAPMAVEVIDGAPAEGAPPPPPAPAPVDGAIGEVKEEPAEAKPDVKMEGEVKLEEVKQEEEEKKVEEEPEEPRPMATLTDEEKAICFKPKASTDLTSWTLGGHFARFCLPDADEGFDEIRYAWNPQDICKDYLHKWVLKNKILCRMEDIIPSDWFHLKSSEWQKVLADWHSKQGEFAAKQAYQDEEQQRQQENAALEHDAMTVPDICNVVNGEPLFAKFTFEDWALLSLRLELHLLVHSFRRDAQDEERVGIHESHLPFYYNKYYKKTFNVKHYGVENNVALLSFIKDTVLINPDNMVIQAQLQEEVDSFDIFVKLTEEARRERMKKLEQGDESARLRFARPEEIRAMEAPQKGGYGKGGGQYGKGGAGAGYKGAATTGYKGGKGYQGQQQQRAGYPNRGCQGMTPQQIQQMQQQQMMQQQQQQQMQQQGYRAAFNR